MAAPVSAPALAAPGAYVLPDLPASWKSLEPETRTPSFESLRALLAAEAKRHAIYPPARDVYRALELTPLRSVRVLLLGQDPYHGPEQAEGLCFSVPPGVPVPASLRNIFRELQTDLWHRRSPDATPPRLFDGDAVPAYPESWRPPSTRAAVRPLRGR